jgi:hypothetical protein
MLNNFNADGDTVANIDTYSLQACCDACKNGTWPSCNVFVYCDLYDGW